MSTDIFPAITSKDSVKQRVSVWKHMVFHDYVIPADALSGIKSLRLVEFGDGGFKY